jgi:hypothetical protein
MIESQLDSCIMRASYRGQITTENIYKITAQECLHQQAQRLNHNLEMVNTVSGFSI